MKKYLVLGILFILPITAYLFFATGTNHFNRLSVLTKNVDELNNFTSLAEENVQLNGKITVLCVFGDNFKSHFVSIFNLTHKIYRPFHEFNDLQFVVVIQEGNEHLVADVMQEVSKITDTVKWKFVSGSHKNIEVFYTSLKTDIQLSDKNSTPYTFIIDKERNLRGRSNDKDSGVLYGYNSTVEAVLNNKMKDDIKILLAEYRLALKKNNNREI